MKIGNQKNMQEHFYVLIIHIKLITVQERFSLSHCHRLVLNNGHFIYYAAIETTSKHTKQLDSTKDIWAKWQDKRVK
jgi:hypothetical protein